MLLLKYSPVSFTSDENRATGNNSIHVHPGDDAQDRDTVSVTYGLGDLSTDTCIFSLDGKLSFVAITEEDVINSRNQNKQTRNDQYNVTIDVSRASSDILERRLNSVYAEASVGEPGHLLKTKSGLQNISSDNFHSSWRLDSRLFLRSFVARPQENFSAKRKFSIPILPSDLIKPRNFVYGPAPIFFDDEGHYIQPSEVRSQALQKDVRVMFTVNFTVNITRTSLKLSPTPNGKIYCNFDVLSVEVLSPQEVKVSASPGKKRRLALGI